MTIPRFSALALAGAAAFGGAAAWAETPLPVQIIEVAKRAYTHETTLTGTVEARRTYPAGFRDGGQVVEVAVAVGDKVAAGDLIARVDPGPADDAFRAATAARAAAAAGFDQAQRSHDRTAALLAQGNATQSDVDLATQDLLTTRASLSQAEADLATARRATEDTELRAVNAAVVIARFAEPGRVVGAGEPIVTLASLDNPQAVFLVPDFPGLESFLDAPVEVSPLDGGAPLKAKVSELAPLVTAQGTVEARVDLPVASSGAYPIGAVISGRVSMAQPAVISVPWTALTSTAAGPAVWRVDPKAMTVSLAPITVAAYRDRSVEVASGLAPGELVVGNGARALYPGRPVVWAEGAQ